MGEGLFLRKLGFRRHFILFSLGVKG